MATQAKEKAEGKTGFYEGQDSNTAESWGRGSAIQEVKQQQAEYDAKRQQRAENFKPREEDNNTFVRGTNLVKTKTEESRPT